MQRISSGQLIALRLVKIRRLCIIIWIRPHAIHTRSTQFPAFQLSIKPDSRSVHSTFTSSLTQVSLMAMQWVQAASLAPLQSSPVFKHAKQWR